MDQSDLGKLLLDKRGGSPFFSAAIIFIVLGGMGLMSVFVVDEPAAAKIVFFIIASAMIAAGVFGIRAGKKRLCVHERGISDTKVAIPFEQIESYSFVVQNMLAAGIHTQTLVTFHFVPSFPAGRLQFHFSFQEKRNIDPAIDVAHDHITASLAARMLNELRNGRPVKWTKALTLRPEGLEYPGPGGAIKTARYSNINDPVAESFLVINKVRLTARDTNAVFATLAPDELNFYPGMLVLEKMRAAASAA
jgi:hypothetical protein